MTAAITSSAGPGGSGGPARPVAEPTEASSVLSTLNDDGSRRWLRPRVSPGRFLSARRMVAIILILVFTALPYITINGKPAVLLNLAARRFTIFGATFLPTDTLLLALLLIGIVVSVFLVTALYGRVWCGWACPQTVYMEFVFRPIERFFDGAPGRARAVAPGSPGQRKAMKFAVYLLISLYLAHTFLAYFVGVEALAQWVRRSPLEHPSSFLIMASVTAAMMFDFTYFREQICIVACPYGRLQSVMLDRRSLIVSYDRDRGEPRGKGRRGTAGAAALSLPVIGTAARAPGDCVDCHLCVTTCPTGIDIRNGLQMECIGCAQCIDACDAVMTKLGRAKGLIRYSSQDLMAGITAGLLRPRLVVYPFILLVVATAFVTVLLTRSPADITVLRGLGAPFTKLSSGEIANQVRLKITNRTDQDQSYQFDATHAPDGPEVAGLRVVAEEDPVLVGPGQSRTVPAMLVAPAAAFGHGALDVAVRVTCGTDFSKGVRYRMVGPLDRPAPQPDDVDADRRGDNREKHE